MLPLAQIVGRVAGILLVAITAVDPEFLGEAQLRASLAGVTIDGVYSDKTTFTESYGADGRIAYTEPTRKMEGHWSIVEGQFCTIYDTSPTGGCYKVKQMSSNCFEFYFASPDEMTAADGDVKTPSWTARAWVKGVASTCEGTPAA